MPKIYFEELFYELGCPKPTPSVLAAPKWFKDMKRFYGHDENLNRNNGLLGGIRACPAVADAIFSGYTLYLPADVYIDATGNSIHVEHADFLSGSRAVEADFPFVLKHDPQATDGYQTLIDFHPETLKWQTYWGVRTEEGYSTLFVHPVHRNDLPFQMVTAIVDTDKFATRAPYAFFIRKGFKGTIPRGTPMLQVFPFKREDWEMEIVEPDSRSYHRDTQLLRSVFRNAYKKIFWERKKYT